MLKLIDHYKRELFASFTLAIIVFVFFPITVYQFNSGAVSYNLYDNFLTLFFAAISAWVIIFLLTAIAKKYVSEYAVILICALIFCLWAQGNLLAYDLGSLDGHIINWGSFHKYYFIELFVWVGIVAVFFFFRKFLYKNINTLLVMILLIEGLPLVLTGGEQYFSPAQNKKIYFSDENKFNFSSDKNVVIVILDTLSSAAVEELFLSNKLSQDPFKDFTFFRNVSAGYPTTMPSIPLILNGQYNGNTIPFNQYINDTQGSSLPIQLKENGFSIEHYSFAPYLYQEIWDNVSYSPPYDLIQRETEKLYFATFLRYFPLIAKPYFMDLYYTGLQEKSFEGQDMVKFYNGLEDVKSVNKPPTFKFIHMFGTHQPYFLNKSLEYIDPSTYAEQAMGALSTVEKMIAEMKSAGVYDNSVILVMGDHGSNDVNGMSSDVRKSESLLMFNGTPLLMAKGSFQNNPSMTYSDSPVSLMDISKSVMSDLNLKNELPGMSIFDEIPENRSRKFYFYEWATDNWSNYRQGFLPPLYEFDIVGNVKDRKSWQFTGRQIKDDGVVTLLPGDYKYGDNVFDIQSLYFNTSLFSSGFRPYIDGAWATGPVSCLFLPVQKTDLPLTLYLEMAPYLKKDQILSQRVNMLLDDHPFYNLELKGNQSVSIPISLSSTELTQDNELRMCFEFPDSKSEQELGVADNFSFYGAKFYSLILYQLNKISLPITYTFDVNGNAAPVIKSGWSTAESKFRWTDGNKAELQLFLQQPDSENINLTVSAQPFLAGGKLENQLVIVRSNGQELGRWAVTGLDQYEVTIPSTYVKDGYLDIEFEIPDAISPVDAGVSQDGRDLGIAVYWIKLESK